MTDKMKHILLVDDDHELVASNQELLEANGYRVSTAYNGADGLEKARTLAPDLMVLDVMMATQSEGFDISRKIPKIPELRNLPVILLTGIREALKLPFGFEPDEAWLPVKVVLEKPVPPDKFLEAIEKHVRA